MSNSFKEDWPKSGVLLGVILGLGLLGVLIILLFVQATPAPAEPDLYGGLPVDEKLLSLDRIALDDAYSEQLRHLFGVWLRNPTSNREFTTGLGIARKAYNTASSQIAKREQQLGR